MAPLYFDHNATTPLAPEVREEMLAVLDHAVGNPSSSHRFGEENRRTLARARERVARLVGAQPEEIYFTSGGTEANNLVLLGAAGRSSAEAGRLVTTAIEHPSVLNPCRQLAQRGRPVVFVPANSDGVVVPEALGGAWDGGTELVSAMFANNDTGVIQPVAELAAWAHEHGARFHTDAVQAVGKIPIDVEELGVDYLSLSAHKFRGPQGAGAVYVRRGAPAAPLWFGGRQERGLRPGTENVAALAGLGKACELAARTLEPEGVRQARLRGLFEAELKRRIEGVTINGEQAPRLPHTSNVGFAGLVGDDLAMNLDWLGLAVSTGAACRSTLREPSHVLLAMGQSPEQARSAVRFSLGCETTTDDVFRAVELVRQAAVSLRGGRHFGP